MAEKLFTKPGSIWNEELGSSEVFSCEPCFNIGVDEDATTFCVKCRIHLCDHCVYEHQRTLKWHTLIDEFGHAYFVDNSKSEHSRSMSEGASNILDDDKTNEDADLEVERYNVEEDQSQTVEVDISDYYNRTTVFPDQSNHSPFKVNSETYVIGTHDELKTENLQDFTGELSTAMKRSANVVVPPVSSSVKIYRPRVLPRHQKHRGIAQCHFDQFALVSEVNVPVHKEFSVSSMTMLSKETIVMVQENTYNVLILNVGPDTKTFKSMYNCQKKPVNVASVRHDEFVLTFPKEHEVRFVKFVEHTFDVGEAIYVHGECSGICMIGATGNMLIAYPTLRELKILTKTGKVVNTVPTVSLSLVFRPNILAAYGGNIFLVDQSRNCVHKCVFFGEKLKVLVTTHLANRGMPTDITVSSGGDVFVSVAFDDVVYRLSGKTLEIKNKYSKEHALYRPCCISSPCGQLTVFEHQLATGYLKVKIFNI